MAKPRATGADARLIGITEVTYGTAPADGYFVLPFKSPTSTRKRRSATTRCSARAAPRRALTTTGLGRRRLRNPARYQLAPASGCTGLLGAPTTTGTGPYTHVFTAGGDTPVEDPGGRPHAAGDAVLSALSRRQLQRLRLQHVAARRRLGAGQRRGAEPGARRYVDRCDAADHLRGDPRFARATG